MGNHLLHLLGQVAALLTLLADPSYHASKSAHLKVFLVSDVVTVVFATSCLQYILASVIAHHGKPFQLEFYRNSYFLLSLLFTTVITLIMNLNPGASVAEFMVIQVFEHEMKVKLVFCWVAQIMVILLFNLSFVPSVSRLRQKQKAPKDSQMGMTEGINGSEYPIVIA